MTKPSGTFWSRPVGPLLLGAAACAACCAVPLAAVVIGAGAATTAAAILEPLAGLLLAASAGLGIALVVRRRRAARRSAVAGKSCGCGPAKDSTLYISPKPSADAPIVCTYDVSDRRAVQAGLDSYRAAFAHLVGTDPIEHGFVWRFRARPGLAERLAFLAEQEHACCSFMKFDVGAAGDEVHWRVQAAPGAQQVVEEFSRLPERLRAEARAGEDLDYIKAAASRSGLVFTKDAAS